MEWSEEERGLLWEAWLASVDRESAARVLAIATRAVELVAARGGTMTAEALERHLTEGATSERELRQHIAAQGARIAQLTLRESNLTDANADLHRQLAEMQRERDAARNEALEEAAKIADDLYAPSVALLIRDRKR